MDPAILEILKSNQEILKKQGEQLEMFSKRSSQQVRSHLKTSTTVEFERGSESALDDLEGWFLSFDRTVDHISNGQGLPAQDRIQHLVTAWKDVQIVGTALVDCQRTEKYQEMESKRNYEDCWWILLEKLVL